MDNVRRFHNEDEVLAEARAWVLKFNGDSAPNQDDILELRKWAAQSPRHREALERATEFWTDANLLSELAVPLARVRSKPKVGALLWYADLKSSWTRLTAAVVVLAAVATFAVYFGQQIGWNGADQGIYRTAVGEQRVLTLADGSAVQLDTDSQIRVEYQPQLRTVHLLRGKAHFEVEGNPERPFEVRAGTGLVRAVGTAFSVQLVDESVKVIVEEGRVDLARVALPVSAETNGKSLPANKSDPAEQNPRQPTDGLNEQIFLSLEQGQGVVFGSGRDDIVELAEKAMAKEQAWRRGLLIFAGEPLKEVLREVTRYTNTNVEITDPSLENLMIGGRFRVGELDALLDVLQAGFGVRVSYVDQEHIVLDVSND